MPETGITKSTRELLDSGENQSVEYKREMNALKPEHFVSFANSETGGTLLVGVTEQDDEEGLQVGIPFGIAISDGNRLAILEKANSCVPPVNCEIRAENLKRIAFFRIDVPSGELKPYCTKKGQYSIRKDGNTSPLYRENLLKILLEYEGARFFSRFMDATRGIVSDLQDMENTLSNTFDRMDHQLDSIQYLSDQAAGAADDSKTFGEELLYSMSSVSDRLEDMDRHVDVVNRNVTVLINNIGLEDVETTEQKNLAYWTLESIHDDRPEGFIVLIDKLKMRLGLAKVNDLLEKLKEEKGEAWKGPDLPIV